MKSSLEQAMKTSREGYVFDIKRFATHDGHGIRTTIFLKGCPLRCAWCQNPEGLQAAPQILYMGNKCMHCGMCAAHAKEQGVIIRRGNVEVHREKNEDWPALVDQCPTGALRYDARLYTLEEIMKEARKDEAFFKYGGGVTLSGGEPLLQYAFAKEILKACQEAGIHTTIETSAYVERHVMEEVYPYVDHFFVDMKLFDQNLHKAYTGVENGRIKDNIRFLLESDKKDHVTIRTPMIPEMSAHRDNVAKIAHFIHSIYPEVHYEILNYNPLAKAKYDYLDLEYCFDDNPKLYTKEQMEVFYQAARNEGITNLIIE